MKLSRTFFPLLCCATSAFAQGLEAPVPFGQAATRTFPFSMAGKLVFSQGDDWFQGSGAVIGARAVLTAAHNLWDADRGFSTEVTFRRAFYGQPAVPDQVASRVFVLKGYREKVRKLGPAEVRTFSDDLGALLFTTPVAGGAFAAWWANAPALTGAGGTIALGYGAEKHDGSELLAVKTAAGYEPLVDSFFYNKSLIFEAGMSGGPVFATTRDGGLAVAGIVVAGAVDATSGGIRALDEKAAAFIRAYLR